MPIQTPSATGPWLRRAGVIVLFLALVGYTVYSIGVNQTAYTAGYFVGVALFFAILIVVFRAVGGRWGCFGAAIRAATIALALLKILTLIRHPLPG